MVRPQISNKGRYSISNTHQELTNCQQMVKNWCIHLFLILQCNVVKKLVHLEHRLCIRVDWVSQSFIGKNICKKADPSAIPNSHLMYLCSLLFWLWQKFCATFCQSIKRVLRVSCLCCWQFSKFQLLNFQTKKLGSILSNF